MILRALSRAGVCGVLFVLAAGRVLGKGPDGRGDDPYVAYHCALDAAHEPTRALRAFIAAVKADAPPPPLKHSCVALIAGRSKTKSGSGNWFLLLAELMKSVGDYNAPQWYERAIAADEREAAFHYPYAEYLRNFRGPQEPLFPKAEKEYGLAESVLAAVHEKTPAPWDLETESRVARGLVALHQSDGLPLAFRGGGVPLVFLSSNFRFARADDDLDQTADVRDYTSAAEFAQSAQRHGAPLTRAQLVSIIRLETPVDTFDRLRVRYEASPVLDIFYDHRHTDEAAITSYYPPFSFNPLQLNSWGVALEKPFTIADAMDVSVAGSYEQTWRKGLIEFHPFGLERIRQFQGVFKLSRFAGRDKFNVSTVYVHQAIDPDEVNSPNRERQLIAPTVSYQFFRPSTFGEHFETRGVELFGGALLDRETYPAPPGAGPSTIVHRHDYFAGVAARGLKQGRWDVTVQPTFFSSAVRPDHTQNNAQYRTNVVVLYRIVDEERQPSVPGYRHGKSSAHLAFLHVVTPFSQDVPREGLGAFRNYKAGVEMDSMWYTTAGSGISFLGSARYDFQRFYALNKDLNLFTLGVSVGF